MQPIEISSSNDWVKQFDKLEINLGLAEPLPKYNGLDPLRRISRRLTFTAEGDYTLMLAIVAAIQMTAEQFAARGSGEEIVIRVVP